MMQHRHWALLGGDSLLGRELRDVVKERELPVDLRLFGGEASTAVLTEEEDEAAVMEPLGEDSLEGMSAVFLAGSVELSRRAMELARKQKRAPVWIDVRGALEDLPESRLRVPALEREPRVAEPGSLESIVHPAAALLGRFFELLSRAHPLRRSVVAAFEPASARGQKGIDELHQQTVSLLSLQSLPQAVFDIQAAFNMLPRFGSEAPEKLEASERRMERHLATILAPRGIPLPSLRLLHAPVFHGYCFSAWVEFEERPPAETVERMFAAEGIDVRTAETEPPSNRAVAGSSGITVGEITADSNDPRAMWFFLAGDNLRTVAENAVMVAGLIRDGAR